MILFFLKRMVMNSLIYRYLNTILDFIWDYGISIASSFKLFTLYQIEYHLQIYALQLRSYLAITQTNYITQKIWNTVCSILVYPIQYANVLFYQTENINHRFDHFITLYFASTWNKRNNQSYKCIAQIFEL